MQVIKRDGTKQEFDSNKIKKAILGAMKDIDSDLPEACVDDLVEIIVSKLDKRKNYNVEQINDLVELTLMEQEQYPIAKAFIEYRQLHKLARNKYQDLMKVVTEKLEAKNVQNQNANLDENTFSGREKEAFSAIIKEYALNNLVSETTRSNHFNNEIYIHDLDAYASGMHNCADGKSWIKVKINNKIKFIQLSALATELSLTPGNIIDLKNYNIEILSRDGWTKLLNLSSRFMKSDELIYTIKTRTGIPLKLTGHHRLPILREGQEILSEVKDLKLGDSLLNVENINISGNDLSDSFLDLTCLDPVIEQDLRITKTTKLANYLKYRYGIDLWEINPAFSRNKYIPLSDFKKLLDTYPISYDCLSELEIKASGSKHKYPLFIPYSPQLAKLYAYIYADGSVYFNADYSHHQICFTNTNNDMIEDFIQCFYDVFKIKLRKIKGKNINGWKACNFVFHGSKIIANLFHDFAGAKKYKANRISIPDFVMNGSQDIKYAYLSACIDTDGYLGGHSISYSSCCKEYCDQLILLLQSLGYHPHCIQDGNAGDTYKFGKITGKSNFDTYQVYIDRNNEKIDLYQKMSCIKSFDHYAYRSISKNFDECRIVDIKSELGFKDPVYDMETVSHWYIINNYVSHNCLSIPLDDLLEKGFKVKQTDVRPAGSINTAMQLSAVIMQLQSLCQFGGVAYTHFDWSMVPYVRKSFAKHYKDGIKFILGKEEIDYEIENMLNNAKDYSIEDEEYKAYSERVYNYALEMTKKEIHQATEALYHNLNTLQSRSGQQLPFSSLNYGTCTLLEGRLIIEELLNVSIEGLGKYHRTSIFPCGIFQLKKGINRKLGEPNYDLYRLALKSTSLRLYPNYANVDWTGNKGYDENDPRTYFSTMGCRTANGADINVEPGVNPQIKDGRGNIAPTTIILPTLAMEADRDVEKFMSLLDQKIHEAKDSLIDRFNYICSQSPKSAPFMYDNNTFIGYKPGEGIKSALKHGTIVIGQLGLSEALQLLIGKDHTTEEGMELAKRIEQLFKDRCKEFKEEWHYSKQKPTDINIHNKMIELAEIKLNRKLTSEEINEINEFKN